MTRKILLLLFVCGLGACGDDSTGPEGFDGVAAGTYTLQSIDGKLLPHLIWIDVWLATAGSLTLNEDLTCSFSISIRQANIGGIVGSTKTEVCTYTFNAAGALSVSWPSDGTSSGSITDSQLTLTLRITLGMPVEGLFIFQK